MEQDDPCILNLLRKNYLFPPSKEKITLEQPDVINPSMGQAQSILEILNNKVIVNNCSFIYCFQVVNFVASFFNYIEERILHRMRSPWWRNPFKYFVHGTRAGVGRYSHWSRSRKLQESCWKAPESLDGACLLKHIHKPTVIFILFNYLVSVASFQW